MKLARHLQNLKPSYIREILSDATAEGVISFAGGLPAPESFPVELTSTAFSTLGERRDVLQYGETAGFAPLLAHLANQYHTEASQAGLVTNGSQQGLDLIARAFLDKHSSVLVEEPAYLGALQVFEMANTTVHTLPQTPKGPDLGHLEQRFSSDDIKAFYAVPDFHNPTGVCWDLQTRQRVAQLCKQYRVCLIEDAPYRDIRFTGNALPLVSSFCPQHALVLRSFSKIAAPGFRLGYVYGPNDWIQALVKVKQAADLHSNLPLQAVLLNLLEHPALPQHIANVRALYHQRYKCMASQLREYLPHCQFEEIAGGMFIWLRLHTGEAHALARACLEAGVAVVPSEVFHLAAPSGAGALRLNFSNATEENIALGVQRLARIYDKMAN